MGNGRYGSIFVYGKRTAWLLLGFALSPLAAQSARAPGVRSEPALSVACGAVDAFCAAANLTELYSAGAAIAGRQCSSEIDRCEQGKAAELAAARSRYLSVRDWLRWRGADRSFEASVLTAGRVPSDSAIAAYLAKSLAFLKDGQCTLGKRHCISATLYLLADTDQAMRQYPSCQAITAERDACLARKQHRMREIDDLSSDFVLKVLARHGWPGGRRWGANTEDNFFLLVQHADARPALQASALSSLRAAAGKGQGSPKHLGYLEDRTRVHAGLSQLYGTQGRCLEEGGRPSWQPDPIINRESLDVRRAKAGMEPFETYRREAIEECGRL